MPEMTADVEIIVNEKEDVLVVPSGAVEREGDKSVVLVKGEDGRAVAREVVTGIEDEGFVEIVEGLKEGETVLMREGLEPSMWRRDRNQRRIPSTMLVPMGRPPR